ncbi:ParB/RepB/Spo0J family partition protein [Amycolatopsis suaedae]|uniref:ParB/RepB/Spo0J family partition protein n=1 Tax=Amycolatopsis suaedae TaxID=2510978 RepID=A0A4Q7JE99_9PSEU|nr:ParB/RepB/Spo0J family partition protein [Amycolatopsis suaedae]RZQ65003.1 ParB/RepB/Spo0J family partition protein [Amycolatopsis suaedae]
MAERRGGLGRGLAALIPTGPAEEPGAKPTAERPAVTSNGAAPAVPGGEVAGAVYREVPLSAIQPNPKQPRQVFDEEALAELEHSIREFGLMQPIVVRELPGGKYELVMGERRLRASQQAELETIPAIVRQTADEAMLRDALLENIHRVQLNPLEEAAAYQQLLDEFEVTHEELAGRIGRSRPVITNTIRLLKLPLPVQRRVAAGVLSAGHARALLSLEDPEAQEDLATRIVAEGMSVRATEEAVTLKKSEAPAKPKAAPRKPIQAPGLQDLAVRLSDTFDTRVKVDLGRRKGRIVVEFGSIDDLERIVSIMDPNGTNRTRDEDV